MNTHMRRDRYRCIYRYLYVDRYNNIHMCIRVYRPWYIADIYRRIPIYIHRH